MAKVLPPRYYDHAARSVCVSHSVFGILVAFVIHYDSDHFNISFIIGFSITRSCERADMKCPRLSPVRERPIDIRCMFNVLFDLLSHPTYTPHMAIWQF